MTDSYIYPDASDAITLKMIDTHEPRPGYWAQSESVIIDKLRDYCNQHMGDRRDLTLLDIGGGMGRLSVVLQDLFSRIVLLEPDITRLQQAEAEIASKGLGEKFEFVNLLAENYHPGIQFDVILNSHVLQHIPVDCSSKLLDTMCQLLKPGGVGAVLTTHAKCTYFVRQSIIDNQVIEQPIEQALFDSLCYHTKDELPIRFFGQDDLLALLSRHGFNVSTFWVYHCLENFGDAETYIARDELVNAIPVLQTNLGRDCFAIVTKA